MSPQQTLELLSRHSFHLEQRHHLPADITLAQIWQETEGLTQMPGHACRRIKATSADRARPEQVQLLKTSAWLGEKACDFYLTDRTGRRLLSRKSPHPNRHNQTEWWILDWFRAYSSFGECLDDWAQWALKEPAYSRAIPLWRMNKDSAQFLSTIAVLYANSPEAITHYIHDIQGILNLPQILSTLTH